MEDASLPLETHHEKPKKSQPLGPSVAPIIIVLLLVAGCVYFFLHHFF